MQNKNSQKLSVLAVMTALTVVLGMFAKLPTPTGVTTLLDVGVYFTAFYFGAQEGAIVGGLSAFLFDLLSGYPQWMVISLVAHGSQGFLAGFKGSWRLIGVVLATVAMVVIYFLASVVMNGFGAALAEVLTNTMQNVVGIIGGYLLMIGFKRIWK